MVLSMPVLRVEEAWRLSVDTSARVTLALRVTPSGEEGVGASASSVSRLCPAHAMRIRVQPCGSVHHCPRAQWFCWGEAQALASDAWHRSLLVCSLRCLQPVAVAYPGGSTRVAQRTWAQLHGISHYASHTSVTRQQLQSEGRTQSSIRWLRLDRGSHDYEHIPW